MAAEKNNSPWEENKKRHTHIISKLEKIRLSRFDVYTGVPLHEIKATHSKIVRKIERLQRKNKAAVLNQDVGAGFVDVLETQSGELTPEEFEFVKSIESDTLPAEEDLSSESAEALLLTPAVKETKREKHSKADVKPKKNHKPQKKSAVGRIAVKRPLRIKLVAIVTALLVISFTIITILISVIVSSDVQLTAEVNNHNINRRNAGSMSNELKNVQSTAISFANDIFVMNTQNAGIAEKAAEFFFHQNPEISAVVLLQKAAEPQYVMPSLEEPDISYDRVSAWIETADDIIACAFSGETVIRNVSPVFGVQQLVMLLPASVPADGIFTGSYCIAVFFSQENLNSILSYGANKSFLLNEDGDVLVHYDASLVLSAANFNNISFVENALSSASGGVQTIYTDENGVEYIGAFQRLIIGNPVLITIVNKNDVFSGIINTIQLNIIISFVMLILSVLAVNFFAATLGNPLRALVNAASKIENGDYNLELSHKSRDEIGSLTQSFISMGRGLEYFEKFTNKSLVKLARRGKLTLSGVNKEVTVSFVFIRDFNEISKKMSAPQIVDFVNEYLEKMIPCVISTGGIIDKFLTQNGVVVMAIWGATESAGSVAADAFNCMRSMMLIRSSLMEFNQELTRRFWGYAPVIKIGCGINSGEVVVGQMGSKKRMEFTIIGDTVNLAARLEGANDVFDTDILVSENTWNLVKDKVIFHEMQSLEVKGKEKPIRVFSAVNMSELRDLVQVFDDLTEIQSKADNSKKRIIKYWAVSMEDVRALWKENIPLDIM
ncbi:MAG: HAMP domain-containing protein [Spirochaetaceae bacterium]|nr:HAMP domain-containing protein [Spirochaetaceae bacterium]